MRKKFFLLLSLPILLCACSLYRLNTEELTYDDYPATNPMDVKVLTENITEPNEVIGRITVNTERNQKMDAVLAKMRVEAAKLGGQAIMNIHSDATGAWKRVPAQKLFGKAYIRSNFTAEVIVFK